MATNTKNIRDGRLILVGGSTLAVNEKVMNKQAYASTVEQDGVYYHFYTTGNSPYNISRAVSNNPLDFRSMAHSNVHSLGTSASVGAPHSQFVWRVSDNVWYMLIAQDRDNPGGSTRDIHITKSTDQGANWGSLTEIITVGGSSWYNSALTCPSIIAMDGAGVYYLFCVGNGDKTGVFMVGTGSDPETPGNWSEYSAINPCYDSAYGALIARYASESGGAEKIGCLATMYEVSGDNANHFHYMEHGYALPEVTYQTRYQKQCGAYDAGRDTLDLYVCQPHKNPVDNLWYIEAMVSGLHNQVWVSERLGGPMFLVPCTAPEFYSASAAKTIEFVDGGLSFGQQSDDVDLFMDRGSIKYIRKTGFNPLTGQVTFNWFGSFDTFGDLIWDGNDLGQWGDVEHESTLVFLIKDESGNWDEYIMFPHARFNISLSEGEGTNKVTLDFTCPLSKPLKGILNSGVVGAYGSGSEEEDGGYEIEAPP